MVETKKEDYAKQLKEAANKIVNTPEGEFWFKHLVKISCWKSPLLEVDATTGDVNMQATLHNVAVRDFYFSKIRPLLSAEAVATIERD
jgi:hypothetical protein